MKKYYTVYETGKFEFQVNFGYIICIIMVSLFTYIVINNFKHKKTLNGETLYKTVITENTKSRKVTVTTIEANNMIVTTILETLPSKDGKNYEDSKVKLLTSSVEFYIRKNDPSSKRVIELQTLKIGGDNDA